jgi:hypothetical protein
VLRQATGAAELGYGALTILEVACDSKHDMGFLIQGKRHFSSLDPAGLATIARARIRGALLVLAGALWLLVGFGLAVLLAARGFVTPSGVWLLTLAPSLAAAAIGILLLVRQSSAVRSAQSGWEAQEGTDRGRSESGAWTDRLEQAADSIVLGAGSKVEAARLRTGLGIGVGALPDRLRAHGVGRRHDRGRADSRRHRGAVLPLGPGDGGGCRGAAPLPRAGRPVDFRRRRRHCAAGSGLRRRSRHARRVGARPGDPVRAGLVPGSRLLSQPVFGNGRAGADRRPLSDFTPEEQAALRQAAAHPAHAVFRQLAQAQLIDVVSGRWILPFPRAMTYHDLPWPRFPAFRTAALARVAKAAVEASDGQPGAAEDTLRDLISTGFLLIDQGPTLIDNLMGVVMADMGGDALEALYARTGRPIEAESLEIARVAASDAARKARAGLVAEDVRSLLQGVPELVEAEEALRGLRWEYFATFNVLAPCINLHKMVFGPDETYDEWRQRARDALVRVRGERDLFDLAESGRLGSGGRELQGVFARFLGLTLGSRSAPGSCASLIASLQ